MKTFKLLILSFCAFLPLAELSAKECPKCRLEAAWGLAGQPNSIFDKEAIGRYQGQVLSVQEVTTTKDTVDGIYILLKTQEGNMAVRLGPSWYLRRQKFQIEPYDTVEILGSKVTTLKERPAIIATKAKVDAKTIALRDGNGKPVWENSRAVSAR